MHLWRVAMDLAPLRLLRRSKGERVSIEAMAIVLHHSRARGTAKVILLGIANHDGDGGSWPSVYTLSRYANCDRSTVQRSIKRLVSLGEIRVDLQAGGTADREDQLRPNLYHVVLECPAGCDRTKHHRMPGDAVIHTMWKDRGRSSAAAAETRPRTGRTDAAQTPHTQTLTSGSAPTTDREDRGPRCSICGFVRYLCDKAQERIDPAARHTFGARS